MTNLQAVLEAAGSDFEHILKVNIFLIDMSDFGAVNAVYVPFYIQSTSKCNVCCQVFASWCPC